MTSGVAILLLGGVEVRRTPLLTPAPVPGRKLQALLALLALHAPHPVDDAELIEEVWGAEQLTNPSNSLQAQVAQLRRMLGRDSVARRGSGYALLVERDDVDVGRFERLLERSQQLRRDGDQRSAAQGFRSAIALVRGPPFAALADHPFALLAAARVEEMIVAAHEGLAETGLALGHPADEIVPLTDLVHRYPFRERFHVLLMRALYGAGRPADALDVYRSARRMLAEELGIEPGPELREAHLAVLSHDPNLRDEQEPEGSTDGPTERAPRSPDPPIDPRPDAHPRSDGSQNFVGRRAELHLLNVDVGEMVRGGVRVALVGGEAGIGKSRLVEEVATEAMARGVAVAWGRCYPGRGAPAFWPWLQAVRVLLSRVEPAAARTALGRTAAVLAELIPEVHDLVPDLEPPTPLDPESARFRSCQAIADALRGLARAAPVMVVVEDVQWSDGPSLQLLSFVASELLEAPVLVVATYRTQGTLTSGPLPDALAELARQPIVRNVELSGLGLEEVRELLHEAVTDPPDDLVRAVHRRTQGNPFFLVETLRLGWDPNELGAPEVPSGVRAVIRQRVSLLPADTVDAMGAAAVLGSDFELALLSPVLDTDQSATLTVLEPAFDAWLIGADPQHPGNYRFSHGLVRDVLYHDLTPSRRARLHELSAQAIEAHHAGSDGHHLLVLADHWCHAVPAVAPERAIDEALRAARWAEQNVAHERAEQHLRAALALLPRMAEGEPRWRRDLQVQYQLSMLLVATTGYGAPGVADACRRMRSLCASVDDEALRVPALWRLAMFDLLADDFDSALEHAEALLTGGDPVRAPGSLLAGHMMLASVRTNRGELAAGRAHFDAAEELRLAGHGPLVAGFVAEGPEIWIATLSAWNRSLLGDDVLAEREATEAVERARAGGDANPYAITYAMWVASLVSLIRRDVALTKHRCEEAIAFAINSGYGMMFVPYMSAHLGWINGLNGDVAGGRQALVAGAEVLRAGGTDAWEHVLCALSADVDLANGLPDDALRHADAGLARMRPGSARWFEAELHRLRGEALEQRGDDRLAAAAYSTAVAVAAAQGAASFGRRARAGLDRLHADVPTSVPLQDHAG